MLNGTCKSSRENAVPRKDKRLVYEKRENPASFSQRSSTSRQKIREKKKKEDIPRCEIAASQEISIASKTRWSVRGGANLPLRLYATSYHGANRKKEKKKNRRPDTSHSSVSANQQGIQPR